MNALALVNNQNLIVNQNNDIDIMNRFIGKVSNKWVDVNVNLQRTNNFILQIGESTNQLNKSMDTSSKKSDNLLDKVKKVSESLFSLSNAKVVVNAAIVGAAKAKEQLIGFQNLMGDKEVGKAYLDKASKQGIKDGFSPDDVVNNTRGFMKVTKNTDKLDNLNGMAARLAVTNPSKGVGESGTAIQNAMSGKFDDLQNKFNFTEADTQILKASKSLDEFMKKMDDMLNKKGLTAENLVDFSNSPMAQVNQLKNNIDDALSGAGEGALDALKPALRNLNKMFSSGDFNGVFDGLSKGLEVVGEIACGIAGIFMDIFNIIQSNWGIITPIIFGIVAALLVYNATMGIAWLTTIKDAIGKAFHAIMSGIETAAIIGLTIAQDGLNAALAMCPLSWIIIAIIILIALFYVVIAIINSVAGTSISATGIILGVFATLGAFLWNLILGVADFILRTISGLVNPFIKIANFIGNIFTNPISSIIYAFQGMADGVLATIEKIASAMDFVFGTSMADKVAGWRADLKGLADNAVKKYAPDEKYKNVVDELDLSVESLGLKRIGYGDAYKYGYNAGEKIGNFDLSKSLKLPDMGDFNKKQQDNFKLPTQPSMPASNLQNNFNTTNENLQNGNDKIDISNEHLEMLRDLAEIESVQNFVTLTPSVEITTGDIKEEADINTIISKIENYMKTELVNSAEGVYV